MKDNLTSYIAIALMILVLCGIVVAVYLFNKPTADVISGDADYQMDADRLFYEFDSDEETANNKYLNKVIEVIGVVGELNAQADFSGSIILETDGMFGVSCEMPKEGIPDDLRVGDKVVIKGLCTGKLMDVVLVKSLIVK